MKLTDLKQYRTAVYQASGEELAHIDTDDLSKALEACERWERRGHVVKLFRVQVTELDHG